MMEVGEDGIESGTESLLDDSSYSSGALQEFIADSFSYANANDSSLAILKF